MTTGLRAIIANLLRYGFTGAVYPVNPNAGSIQSVRAYPSVGALPEPIDLAVIVVPKERVLDGIRGAPPVDFGALTDVLLRVSQLAIDQPEIAELDVNPLLAFSQGVKAVDARVLLAR